MLRLYDAGELLDVQIVTEGGRTVGNPTACRLLPRPLRIGRTAEIHFPAIRKLDVPRTPAERAVLRLEGGDFDPGSGGKRIPVPTQTEQYRRRSAFNSPVFHRTVRLGHVDLQPGMRI